MASPADLRGLAVGHLGHFDPGYARNLVMGRALRAAGAEVVELRDTRTFRRRTPALLRQARGRRLDVLLVGFPGYMDVATARALALPRHIPVISDTFVSLYETGVEDRQVAGHRSLSAWNWRAQDWLSSRLADLVILDTQAHIDYFVDRYRIDRARFRRVWIGADEELLQPRPRAELEPPAAPKPFQVLFVGTFIPLHGFDHIVAAASHLEKEGRQVDLVVAGGGQTLAVARADVAARGLTSVRFLGQVPRTDLPDLIARADVCLGIFGTSGKAHRVIPNKVFEALAMARPVVTADTAAAREALVDGVNARLCPPGDGAALAAAIASLQDDPAAARAIADGGYRLFRERFSVDALAVDVTAAVADALRPG